MHYAYAVTRPESFSAVWKDAQPLIAPLTDYLSWLRQLGAVEEPRGIVFHDLASATTVFSTHVLPAWTNLSLIHLDPVVHDWKQIYLSALSTGMPPSSQQFVEDYYQSLDSLDIATIGAHELTHHLHLFMDVSEDAMWFEEGFCFYAPRKHLLPPARLTQLQRVEQMLIETHEARLGKHPIWQFGLTDTGERFTDALFDYWRAIYAVSQLGEIYAHGDLKELLAFFEQWHRQEHRSNRLDAFLIEALGVSQDDQRTLWLC